MELTIKFDKYRLLFFVELIWILIDVIGGVMLNQQSGESKLNAVLRGGIILYLFYFIIEEGNKEDKLNVILFTLFILTLTMLQAFIFGSISFLAVHLRLLLIPLFYFALKIQIQNNKFDLGHAKAIIYFSFAILFINIILGFLNIGYSFYGVRDGTYFGGKGFFYANNVVGATYIVLAAFLIWLHINKGLVEYGIVILLLFISSVGILSKTAVFGFFFLFLASTFHSRPKVIPFFAGSGLLIAVLYGEKILVYANLLFARVSYFAKSYGVVTVILGGYKRLSIVETILSEIAENPLLLLIGKGWNGHAENNLFDLIEAFGILGLIFYFFWFVMILNLYRRFKVDKSVFPILIGFVLIFFISILAGHIVESALISLYIALLGNIPRLLSK